MKWYEFLPEPLLDVSNNSQIEDGTYFNKTLDTVEYWKDNKCELCVERQLINETRYLLYGDTGGWDSFIFKSDSMDEIKAEAGHRAKMGYSCIVTDFLNNCEYSVSFKLKDILDG